MTGCGLGRKRPVHRPQTINRDVVKERGEPHLLVLPRRLARAIQVR
jgi:hypothetical protein